MHCAKEHIYPMCLHSQCLFFLLQPDFLSVCTYCLSSSPSSHSTRLHSIPTHPQNCPSKVTPDLILLMLVSCHLGVSAMTWHRSSILPERQLPWTSELSHSFLSPTSAVMSFQFPLPGLQVYFLGDTSKSMATNCLSLIPALSIAL